MFICLIESQEILEDDYIVKVGVSPNGDANYLVKDYGVCVASTFDLRYMAALCNCRPGGLAKMSEDYLNVKLEKNWRIRCSDWEAPTLSKMQTDYAANDAHVAIELFKYFSDKLEPKPFLQNQSKYVQYIVDEYCFQYFDINYNGQKVKKNDSTKGKNKPNLNKSNSA